MSLNENPASAEKEVAAPVAKPETKPEPKAAPEPERQVDIRELVAQTFDEMADEEEGDKPKKKPKPKPKKQEPVKKEAKESDEGKDLKQEKEQLEKKAAAKQISNDQEPADDEDDDDSDDDSIPAPHSWKKEAREHWAKIPRETQEYLAQRDKEAQGDYTKKTQELSERAKKYEALDSVFTPEVEQDFAYRGINSSQWVKQALAVERDIKQNKELGALKFLASIGADPHKIASLVSGQPAGNGTAAERIDPQTIQRLVQTELKRNLGQMQIQHAVRDIGQVVNEFKSATDSSGRSLHPYVDQIETEMAGIIPVIMQSNPQLSKNQVLDKAYDYCCKGNPEIREKLEQDTRHAEEHKRAQERTEKVNKARTAGSSIPQRSGGANALDSYRPKEIREIASQAYDTLNN